MTTGATTPDLPAFRALADSRRVIPVTRRFLADGETPVGLYRKLAAERPGTFLLESAEHGVWSRYSFIGVRSELALTERDGAAAWIGTPPAGAPTGGEPLEVLRATLDLLRTPHDRDRADLPPLTGGFVGFLGYDTVRRLERVGEHAKDDLDLPELTMLLAADLAVLDHTDGTVTLIANAINLNGTPDGVDAAYHGAVARLDAMAADLTRPDRLPPATLDLGVTPAYTANRTGEDFRAAVDSAKEEIRAGEAFQIVLSQRFEMATDASALDVYRVLRATNPSPYMYLFRFPSERGAFDVVGSSPEALVKVTDGEAMLHPIAGTRPRGATPEQDAALAEELLADPKERAEHLMLVDLGRNDLGRISAPGSVEVLDFMSVERYSHVMHLVSTVVGTVSADRSALDVLLAAFPAGTLSGAPKPRALQIIDDLEPTRRGVYGGCVGYLDFAGNSDTAIAIRTALLRDGTAYVQAGAGIVADSVPESEDAECRNKAMAVLRAIAAAGTLRAAD
ncbi:anthranilate synthase component I [Actinospica sp.]|jgi:anthranilate synthase component 1|uniref:anthranilate synthase component I n=1 Tax=Actinospica sp. TaxID=1872142 RepID=UPI002B845E0A|nr:anthranilate synthase component I [Actinospica sp.]HWG25726.1 anthranilate synthase component I [Actinospica sp.]